ncbi:MAG TPA: type IV toxin-antitoxin system AbiEi family antitoxin domain-containing protein [Solirubrobacteraceae bacterium]
MRTELCIQNAAGRRKGLITRRQLEEIGLSSASIARRVETGRLHRKHHGVYAVGRADLTIEGEVLAAALAIGEDAVVSHFAAAFLWGFWRSPPEPPFDVTVPRRVRSRAAIRVHCVQTLARADRTWWRGVPVTTAARTLNDLASVLRSDAAMKRAAHEAQSLGRVTHAQIEAVANPRLAKLIAPGPRPTRSELEDAVDDLLTRHGLRPPQTNVTIAGHEVDFLYPEHGVVIEADGARYHDTPLRQAQDRRKQAVLESHGLRVLRLRWEDTRPEHEAQTVDRVRRALAGNSYLSSALDLPNSSRATTSS